jgi:hypothetical protein
MDASEEIGIHSVFLEFLGTREMLEDTQFSITSICHYFVIKRNIYECI